MTIWLLRPSCQEDRPDIPFSFEMNAANDWLLIGDVLSGNRPAADFPGSVSVYVPRADALEWDFYLDGGARGLLSKQFVEVIGDHALRYFRLLPASLNDAPYFFLRCEKTIDCLDLLKSKVRVFPHNPTRVMQILHYEFNDSRLPVDAAFSLPEAPLLYVTDSVAERIRSAKLKGVDLRALQ